MPRRLRRLRSALALEPAVASVAAAVFVFGFAQELWASFLPEYLRVLGASALALGLFGTLEDLLDAAYAYPGGALSDRLGTRRALVLFGALSTAGFGVYLAARSPAAIFAGVLLVAAWKSLGLPATFSVIGRELAGRRRVVAFSVQATLKRLPILLAPPLGGLLLARRGIAPGIRVALAASIALAVLALVLLTRGALAAPQGVSRTPGPAASVEPRGKAPRLRPALRRLLVADCLVRLCEGLPEVFLVVWALETVRVSPVQFGALQSIRTAASLLSYLPAAALAGRVEKKPFVVLTFLFFALFPAAVCVSRSFAQLAAAYVIGGLREIGEPARKALIVDLSDPASPGRSVGLYYAIRGGAVAGAAAVGGALWTIRPELTFAAAALLGAAGAVWSLGFLPASGVRPEAA